MMGRSFRSKDLLCPCMDSAHISSSPRSEGGVGNQAQSVRRGQAKREGEGAGRTNGAAAGLKPDAEPIDWNVGVRRPGSRSGSRLPDKVRIAVAPVVVRSSEPSARSTKDQTPPFPPESELLAFATWSAAAACRSRGLARGRGAQDGPNDGHPHMRLHARDACGRCASLGFRTHALGTRHSSSAVSAAAAEVETCWTARTATARERASLARPNAAAHKGVATFQQPKLLGSLAFVGHMIVRHWTHKSLDATGQVEGERARNASPNGLPVLTQGLPEAPSMQTTRFGHRFRVTTETNLTGEARLTDLGKRGASREQQSKATGTRLGKRDASDRRDAAPSPSESKPLRAFFRSLSPVLEQR